VSQERVHNENSEQRRDTEHAVGILDIVTERCRNVLL